MLEDIVMEKAGPYVFHTRPDTLDHFVIRENFGSKQYLKYIGHHLDAEDVWIDAGAHIGAFAVSIAEVVNKIVCFEPRRDNFGLLKKNIRINKLKNVTVINAALVGNNDITRDIFSHEGKNTGSHSFMPIRGRYANAVRCVNFDAMLREHGANKIKMDIEGAEYELLYATKMWKHIDEIIMEFHPEQLHDKDLSMFRHVLALLEKNGFKTEYHPVRNFSQVIIHAKK